MSHGYELLDGLQGGKLEIHVQRSFVSFEKLNHLLAVGRRDDVSHERFRAQLANAHLRSGSERMLGGNDEYEFVKIYDNGMQAGFLRFVGEHAEFGAVAEDVVGDVAAQSAFHRDLDHRMQAAEFGEQGQQVEHGEFV